MQVAVDIALHLLADRSEVPGTMGEAFEALAREGVLDGDLASRMRRAVGFRNIAVHAYERIDWGIVARICAGHLGDFEEYARAVWRHVQAGE